MSARKEALRWGTPKGRDVTTTARGRVRVEGGQKRVRVYLGSEVVADSTDTKLVWEKPYYPTYYFPASDVNSDLLVATGDTSRTPRRGEARVYTVKTARSEATGAARWYEKSPLEEIEGHISFRWRAMDAWFEEDEQVYVHPRDPYTRVDILQSSRHVRGRDRRRNSRRHPPAASAFRDRPAGALLHPEDGRAHGPPRGDRHRDGVPVQGDGELLQRHRRRPATRRHRVVVPAPRARERPHRRIRGVLQREGSTSTSTASWKAAPRPSSASGELRRSR